LHGSGWSSLAVSRVPIRFGRTVAVAKEQVAMNGPSASAHGNASTRQFTVVDRIVLISALGLGLFRAGQTVPILVHLATNDNVGPFQNAKRVSQESRDYYSVLARRALRAFAAFLTPPGAALVLLRFVPPRRSLRRCFRQPGAIACAVASLAVCFEIGNHILNLTVRLDASRLTADLRARDPLRVRPSGEASVLGSIAFGIGTIPGWLVAGAYLALWAAGLFRPERSWIDRAGRVLGWLWMVMAAGFVVLPIRSY
jgi:hypothetical protein